MNEKQSISIGSIVHYMRNVSSGGEYMPELSPAVVTAIHDDGDCQLFVMNQNGVYFCKSAYSDMPKPGYWSWPVSVL